MGGLVLGTVVSEVGALLDFSSSSSILIIECVGSGCSSSTQESSSSESPVRSMMSSAGFIGGKSDEAIALRSRSDHKARLDE